MVAFALAGFGAPASAQTPWEMQMQVLIEDDGAGRIFANTGQFWNWEACTADLSSCAPYGSGRDLRVAGVPPGTVFRLNGSTVSPEWLGDLAPISVPTVSGLVRANEMVTPLAGSWRGGWVGSADRLQLAACPTPAGEGCTTLTHLKFPGECPGGAAVIDPHFTGQYLRVADRRIGPGPIIETLEAVTSPYSFGAWPAFGSTSAAVVGIIEPAARPRTDTCGPPPLGKGKGRVLETGEARANCIVACSATLVAKRGRLRQRVTRKLVASPGADLGSVLAVATLRIPGRALARLGAGKTLFVLRVGGTPVARRAVFRG